MLSPPNQRNLRVSWCCKTCGQEHVIKLPHFDAVVAAGELLRLGRTDTVLIEDEASALTDELDEADAEVRAAEQARQVAKLLAHGLVLPADYILPATRPGQFGAISDLWDPSRYRKD